MLSRRTFELGASTAGSFKVRSIPVLSGIDQATCPIPSISTELLTAAVRRCSGGGCLIGPTKSFLSKERQMEAPESQITGNVCCLLLAQVADGYVMAALRALSEFK